MNAVFFIYLQLISSLDEIKAGKNFIYHYSRVSMAQRLWTREEYILSLDLYFRIPFGQFHKNNPDVQKLAELINRTPSSVAMRLCNFASCDPVLKAKGIEGLRAGVKTCSPYWDEFAHNRGKLISMAEACRAKLIEATDINSDYSLNHISEWDNLVNEMYDFKFQAIIKRNYNDHCAISGVKIPQLLTACHIIPVSESEEESIKADNGLLLSLNFAKAYVNGLIGIDDHYILHLSDELLSHQFDPNFSTFFRKFERKELLLNDVAVKPDKSFLQWHMDTVFNSNTAV